jgi:outer membrane protein TolC
MLFWGAFLAIVPQLVRSQPAADTLSPSVSLQECIEYALSHQPLVRQAQLDEQIVSRTVKSRLADWYPQLNLTYNVQHYLKLPVIILPDFANPGSGARREVQSGVANTSTAGFSLNQNLLNRDLLLANRTAQEVYRQAAQNTVRTKVDVVVDVSKAFYDVLLTQQQLEIVESEIVRSERNLRDAFNQFQGGIVDKTDYKRATIALNNSKARYKQASEELNAKKAYLKSLMGYPAGRPIDLELNNTSLDQEAFMDTTRALDYNNRIEYQLLQTRRNLQQSEILYNRWSFLPTVSAFLNYNTVFQNQEFSNLYNRSFPNSFFGLSLALPIFQGGRRIHNIRIAELELNRLDSEFTRLQNVVNAEYEQALASYKANLTYYLTLKENVDLAREVYDVIQLQYKSGVKTYLDVIIAQTDLQTAEFNYTNALYQLISSKLDVERALGTIQP